jgi:hypothetical protein
MPFSPLPVELQFANRREGLADDQMSSNPLRPEAIAAPIDTRATPERMPAVAEEPVMQKVLPRDLVPGDVVSPAWSDARISAFDSALVERVTEESITLFRPYATTPNFVYGREPSVIPLIGVKRYEVRRCSTEYLFRRWHSTVT